MSCPPSVLGGGAPCPRHPLMADEDQALWSRLSLSQLAALIQPLASLFSGGPHLRGSEMLALGPKVGANPLVYGGRGGGLEVSRGSLLEESGPVSPICG